jgi:PAS domain S-box-containing protein
MRRTELVSSSRPQQTQAGASLAQPDWRKLSNAVDALFQRGIAPTSFERALDLLVECVGDQYGAVAYLDEFDELVSMSERGIAPSAHAGSYLVGSPPEEWEGAWGAALRDGRTHSTTSTPPEGLRSRLKAPIQLATPISFGGRVIGVLCTASEARAEPHSADDMARIELIAARLAPLLAYELSQRRFKRQLNEAEQMATAAAEGERFFMLSRDLMTIMDTHVRRANHAFAQLLGWEEYELRNRSLDELIHPDDRELLAREFNLMRTEPNREQPPLIVRMISKGGETRRVEWVGAATDEGRIYAVGRDVSALTQAVANLAEKNTELERLHAEARAEEQVAGRLMAHVRSQGCLDAPGIQYVASSLGFFNGDVALAALTPSGELRWMLGDFTGHGLSAAIGTVPLAGAFHTSCRQDLPFEQGIAIMNDLLKSLLPPGLFCSAGFLSLNREGTVLRVWNSGLPPIVVRRIQDGSVHLHASESLPLGLLDSRELNIAPANLAVVRGDEVFIFSDGLTEATNAAGQLFGTDGVQRALAGPGEGFAALVRGATEFRAGVAASDDLSLVSVCVGHTPTLSLDPLPRARTR